MRLEQMTFEQIYIEYFSNFLTIERMAEYYNVPIELLTTWIEIGRKVNHCEAWEDLSDQINQLYLNLI